MHLPISNRTKGEGRNLGAYRCTEDKLCRVQSLKWSSYWVVLDCESAEDPFWTCKSHWGPHDEVHMLIGVLMSNNLHLKLKSLKQLYACPLCVWLFCTAHHAEEIGVCTMQRSHLFALPKRFGNEKRMAMGQASLWEGLCWPLMCPCRPSFENHCSDCSKFHLFLINSSFYRALQFNSWASMGQVGLCKIS